MNAERLTLTDMPKEIISYIFRHLSLIDIMHLIKINKYFRKQWEILNQIAYDKIKFSSLQPQDKIEKLYLFRHLRYIYIDTAYHSTEWRTDYFVDACFRQKRLEKLCLVLNAQPIITNNVTHNFLQFMTHLEVRIKEKDTQVDSVEHILLHVHTLITFIYHNGVLSTSSLIYLARNKKLTHIDLKCVAINDPAKFDLCLQEFRGIEHLILDHIYSDNIRTMCKILKYTISHLLHTFTYLRKTYIRIEHNRNLMNSITYLLLKRRKNLKYRPFLNNAFGYLSLARHAQQINNLYFKYLTGLDSHYGMLSYEIILHSQRRIREYCFMIK